MKVHMVGFKVEPFSGVDFGDVFQDLENKTDVETNYQFGTVVPYFSVISGWAVGLLVRFRSNKKSIISKRDSAGDLLVDKQQLASDEHGTEVTICVLNPSTLKGLFYSYRGAVTPNGLKHIFRNSYATVRRQNVKDYKNQLTHFGENKISTLSKKVKEAYPNDFDLKLLATPRDVAQVLKHFQEITSLHVNSEDALGKL